MPAVDPMVLTLYASVESEQTERSVADLAAFIESRQWDGLPGDASPHDDSWDLAGETAIPQGGRRLSGTRSTRSYPIPAWPD